MFTHTPLTLRPEQWAKVREYYSQLVDLPIEDRARLVAELSGNDSQIEAQLRELFLAHDQSPSFLDEPAVKAFSFANNVAALPEIAPGGLLANRYTVRRLLNYGGMGAVYEAWDSELQESVALKLIRPDIASIPEVIERFKQEVKQGRRVTHPNICRVFDLSSHDLPDGTRLWFLTMQLLRGETLLETIRAKGPIPQKKALALIGQMVAALEAAHDQGIVHRDFKSANVMLVRDGADSHRAVVTDFGLAASVIDAQTDESIHAGQGTPAYAPPEQWRDGRVSPAADQYSLGVVMCEMLTGMRPVPPRQNPDRTWSRAKLPSHANLNGRLQTVIHRCVEADPEKRFKSLLDLNRALGIGRQRMVLRMLAVPAAMLLIAVGVRLATTKPARYILKDATQLTPPTDLSTNPSLSRDGSTIVYAVDGAGTGGSDIWIRHLPDGPAVQVTHDGLGNEHPSLSLDGKRVTYESSRQYHGAYLANADGTGEVKIADGGRSPRFSPDGRSILYWTGDQNATISSGKIYVFSIDQRRTTQLASEFADAREPIWNSDGRHILFRGCKSRATSLLACWDWWVTTIDGMTARESGARSRLDSLGLTPWGEMGGWYGNTILFSAAQGHAIHLWALALSASDWSHPGEPVEVVTGDAQERVFSSSLSETRVVAITKLAPAVHVWRLDPNASGPFKGTQVTRDADRDGNPTVSPGGRKLVLVRINEAHREIRIVDTASGLDQPYAVAGSNNSSPLVDDDGSKIAYENWDGPQPAVYLSTSSGAALQVCSDCRISAGWFNGGDGLFLTDPAMSQISLYNLKTRLRNKVLSVPGQSLSEATWSSANQMLLFMATSDHVRHQVFAIKLPAKTTQPVGDLVPITDPAHDAILPRWSGDGKTVYYISDQDRSLCIWAQKFESGKPVGEPLEVQHFARMEFSLDTISRRSLNMSVAGNEIYVNIAQINSSIWIGHFERKGRLAQLLTVF